MAELGANPSWQAIVDAAKKKEAAKAAAKQAAQQAPKQEKQEK